MAGRGLGSPTQSQTGHRREGKAALNLSSRNVGLAFHKAIQGVDMRWWT